MLSILWWLVPAVVPALLLLGLVFFSDTRREPVPIVLTTFFLGGAFGGGALYLEYLATRWTGLDVRTHVAGNAGALVFIFAFVAPVREASKVAAMWPAFRSRHFDEPYDGVVYAAASALGFAVTQNARMLMVTPHEVVWLARAALALPANLFFATAWGYALGRAKRQKTPGPIFPASWLLATVAHGLYSHLVWGRGSGALAATLPLLLPMGALAFFAARDLRQRGDAAPSTDNRLEPVSLDPTSGPPSLGTVREALRRRGRPLVVGWIVLGALMTIGAMILGLVASVAFGHWAHVDFSIVDERDVSTTGPVALLGAGVLSAFPLSGYLLAKASALPSLLEPALASGLAIVLVLGVLGFAAPISLLFALTCSPIAWALACAGAWVGRPHAPDA
ncbi:MAG TPA: PrsW family glutamic-type intramembrane protease [Polyangiaceae bacterium]|nr:PrsW family glutamic-type intramembrane protease [Polyangiaceae bacterium]